MELSLVLAVVLGLALIGTVFELIRSERKRAPAGAPARPAPANVTGREALDVIDLGLRRLAAACVRAGRALPDAYAVVYSGDRLALRLAGSDSHAPAPWSADSSGEQWSTGTAPLEGVGLGEEEAAAEQPYALAVTLGTAGGERVLVDLSRAATAIAVTGGGREARQLVRAFVAELVTGPVGRRAEVTLVGSTAGADLTVGLGSARLHTVATLEEALARGADAATRYGASGSAAAVTQVFRMIEGGGPVAVQGRAPRLFVLDAAQYADEQETTALLEASDALLVLGDASDAGWRFGVGEDGSLDTGPLDLRIDVHAGRLN
ncbi:hypothetical protein [Streptomyces sp. NPDC059957]|uniref:hypothetical protein n=1 Tax=unclassified Streptomyces TaxID=2593676 RepID=UPI0036563E3C